AHENARLSEMAAALTHTRNQLSALVVGASKREDADALQDQIDDLRAQREALEQSIAEESSQARSFKNSTSVGLSEVLAALPAESALLAFVAYERISPDGSGGGKV